MDETWPPAPEGQRSTEPTYYLTGDIEVMISGGVLVFRNRFVYKPLAFAIFVCFILRVCVYFFTRPHHLHHMFLLQVVGPTTLLTAMSFGGFALLQAGIYRITTDGVVAEGGAFIPNRYERAIYVRRVARSATDQGVSLVFDKAQRKPYSHRMGQPNEIVLKNSFNQDAAERVAEIIGDFLKVPVIVE